MSRKLVVLLFLLALMIGGVSAQDSSSEEPTLRIGVLPVLNTIPLYVAQEQGFYAEEGITVELLTFPSADLQGQAIEAGELDGVNTDLVRVISRYVSGSEIAFKVIRHDPPVGAPFFAIVANKDSGIATVEDLAAALEASEAQIAISTDSVIEYLTTTMLRSAGYEPKPEDYNNVPPIPVRLELLAQGNIAAASLPEPLVTFTTTIQGNVLIIDDTVAEYIPTVLAFSQTILDENPEAVEAFLRAYERAVELINENPDTFRDTEIQVPDPVRATYTVPQFSPGRVPTEEEFMLVADWMLERELIAEPVPYEDIVDGSFLPEELAPEATEAAGG